MNTANTKRHTRRPRSSGQSRFRVVPVWKQDFDRDGFARALLLLAMHLDEQEQLAHKKTKDQHTRKGGGNHE